MAMLPYGYYDVLAGEESSTEWMPHIKENWARIADHDHDGSNSKPISISALSKTSQTLSSASWAASGAQYKQTVTMPGSFTFANAMMCFFISEAGNPYDGSQFYPTIVKVGISQYDIYVLSNTMDVVVLYI